MDFDFNVILGLRLSKSLDELAIGLKSCVKSALNKNALNTVVYLRNPFKLHLCEYDDNSGKNERLRNLDHWCQSNGNTTHSKENTSTIQNLGAGSKDNHTVYCWSTWDSMADTPISSVLITTNVKSQLDSLKTLSEQIVLAYNCVVLSVMNLEKQKIIETIASLLSHDVYSLSQALITKLMALVQADSGTVLVMDDTSEEIHTRVCGDSLLDEEIRFELCNSGFMYLYSQPKIRSFTKADIQNSQLNSDLKFLTNANSEGMILTSMMVVPVTLVESTQVIAFVCLFNKHNQEGFTSQDETLVADVVHSCSPMMENAMHWEKELVLRRQNASLLGVAENLFRSLDDVTVLLQAIMEEARNLMKAERCSLFLVDHETEELVAKVFDGAPTNDSEVNEFRIPKGQGIAGHVACTGEMLNIRDAYSHPLFYKEVDIVTGFRTKHILCFPIKDETEVLAVAQLCNKVNGPCFSKFDEGLTSAFALFVGISLVQSLLYKKASDAQKRSQLANELMMYHMQVMNNDTEGYLATPLPIKTDISSNLDSFQFLPRITLAETDTIRVVLAMFNDLGFIKRWKIREKTLVRFCLVVKKGYRDPPYHNWTHAWTVAHFCYILIKNLPVYDYLGDLELFVLFVACLCHDLDHRGTTNSFQISSKSVLASLYSSAGSVMEHHHFAQAMCIINSEGCNVFESLANKEYGSALDLMQHIILATDLGTHFQIIPQIEQMVQVGFDNTNQSHRQHVLSLLMTSCDLSDQTKPWEGALKVSDLLYAEFFAQGDMEKSLGYSPVAMMDREKARIPKLQVDFISKVAMPLYRLLSDVFPAAHPVFDQVEKNREMWKNYSL